MSSVSGTILRASTRVFAVGDWIEIGNIRGEIIHKSLLSTIVHQVGSVKSPYDYTGKTITIPNSLLLTQPATNLNFMKRYVFHRFTITVPDSRYQLGLQDWALAQAKQRVTEFIEVARRYNSYLETHSGIDIADAQSLTCIFPPLN